MKSNICKGLNWWALRSAETTNKVLTSARATHRHAAEQRRTKSRD